MGCVEVIPATEVELCQLLDEHQITLKVVEDGHGQWTTVTEPRLFCYAHDWEGHDCEQTVVGTGKTSDEALASLCGAGLTGRVVLLDRTGGLFAKREKLNLLHTKVRHNHE